MEPKQVKDLTSLALALLGCVLGVLANIDGWIAVFNF